MRKPLTARVVDVVDETADARSISLDVQGGYPYRSGQFVTVRIPLADGRSAGRCYSLCSSPHTDEAPTFTVKRVDGGIGSNWLCDNAVTGLELEVLPAAGTFTPKSYEGDVLLCAAGSGITPVLSIVQTALLTGTGHVTLFYANTDEASVIFAGRLRELAVAHPDRLLVIHRLDSLNGLPTIAELSRTLAPWTTRHAYLCGPAPFMATVSDALHQAGGDSTRIHREIYQSLASDPFAAFDQSASDQSASDATDDSDAVTAVVHLDGEVHEFAWRRSLTLVEALLARDVDVPYSCRSGECGACACTVVEGAVDMAVCDALDPEDVADGYALGCQSRPTSDRVVIEF